MWHQNQKFHPYAFQHTPAVFRKPSWSIWCKRKCVFMLNGVLLKCNAFATAWHWTGTQYWLLNVFLSVLSVAIMSHQRIWWVIIAALPGWVEIKKWTPVNYLRVCIAALYTVRDQNLPSLLGKHKQLLWETKVREEEKKKKIKDEALIRQAIMHIYELGPLNQATLSEGAKVDQFIGEEIVFLFVVLPQQPVSMSCFIVFGMFLCSPVLSPLKKNAIFPHTLYTGPNELCPSFTCEAARCAL